MSAFFLALEILASIVLTLESLTATFGGMQPAASVSTDFPFFLDLSIPISLSTILIYYALEVMHFPCKVVSRSYYLLGVCSVPWLSLGTFQIVSWLIFTRFLGVGRINYYLIYFQIKVLRC